MGLACSQLAPRRSWQPAESADGISPDDLHKGARDPQCLRLGSGKNDSEVQTDDLRAGKVTAEPLVVIGWVLREVIAWPSIWQATDLTDERLKIEVKTEVHVARLLRCWEKHGELIISAFVEELSQLVTNFQAEDCTSSWTLYRRYGKEHSKLERLASFLADALMCKLEAGSQELWVFVLAGIRRYHEQLSQAGPACAGAAATLWRERTVFLLRELQLQTYLRSAATVMGATRENRCSLCVEISKLWGELNKAQDEARKEYLEVNKARILADLRASLSRAPWEEAADLEVEDAA